MFFFKLMLTGDFAEELCRSTELLNKQAKSWVAIRKLKKDATIASLENLLSLSLAWDWYLYLLTINISTKIYFSKVCNSSLSWQEMIWVYTSLFHLWWKTLIWEWLIEQVTHDLRLTEYSYTWCDHIRKKLLISKRCGVVIYLVFCQYITEFPELALKFRAFNAGEWFTDEDYLSQKVASVLKLIKPFFKKGYHIFTDNYYHLFALDEFLWKKKHTINGTLSKYKTDDLKVVIQGKYKKSEIILRAKQMFLFVDRNKNVILTIWTNYTPKFVKREVHTRFCIS